MVITRLIQREHWQSREAVVSALTPSTFDQAEIREYVGGSYYNYGVLDPACMHPFDGKTTPNMGSGGYSWIKSPRYGELQQVCEVGPLARMVNTHLSCYTGSRQRLMTHQQQQATSD